MGSEIETYDVRSNQASDTLAQFASNEYTALVQLTKMHCQSTPNLVAWKQEKQDESGLVPGGFILFMVMGELPGCRLNSDIFWKLPRQERDDIREAFQVAWKYVLCCGSFGFYLIASILQSVTNFIQLSRDCVKCGIRIYENNLANLLWDKDNKRV